jgi:hypothetical protein
VFQYRYYVLVTDGFSRESPYGLIRARKTQPSSAPVEFFTPETGWEQSSLFTLDVLGDGAVPISRSEVKGYESLFTQHEAAVEKKVTSTTSSPPAASRSRTPPPSFASWTPVSR